MVSAAETFIAMSLAEAESVIVVPFEVLWEHGGSLNSNKDVRGFSWVHLMFGEIEKGDLCVPLKAMRGLSILESQNLQW